MATTRERIARNFIDRYGEPGLRRLVERLSDGVSGAEIAAELGVSRERVRQWKNAFGRSVTLYQVHPDVQRVLARSRPATRAQGESEPLLIELVSDA